MLTIEEIKKFIAKDKGNKTKQNARIGEKYYEGIHDILNYRMFYFNTDGELVEDTTRSNIKIPHPYFTELVDQGTQYVLSGGDIFKSDIPGLQSELDKYFNMNESFIDELSDTITGQQVKGCDFMYCIKNDKDEMEFYNANSLNVIEVSATECQDGRDNIIYRYTDTKNAEGKEIKKIRVIDSEYTYFYIEERDKILSDESVELNPRPHALYERRNKLYTKDFGFLPFFRLDYNQKRTSHLNTIKPLIDDYDLMASSLSNNLADFDTPIHVVRGYEGTDLSELQTNLKTKKIIGVGEEGGMDIKTIDVPYQARVTKLELDEKNIYRFGFGLNLSSLKDTSATTNIAIKASYSLLDLRASKIIKKLKPFLREILKVVLDEINEKNETDYRSEQVYFDFTPEIMSNALENTQIKLSKAQEQQTQINTLLALSELFDNETLMQNICDVLELDYNLLKNKLPKRMNNEEEIAKAIEKLRVGLNE